MDFTWNSATLLALFVGIVTGVLVQKLEDKRKKNQKVPKFCPHCGESLETKE